MISERRELFERTPVLKAILKVSLPSIFSQIIIVLYNMADTLYIGLSESDVMLTAVSICAPIFTILTAISNLFGIGASSLMARFLGKHDHANAKKTTAFAFWGCLTSTIIYCLLVLALMRPLINVIGGSHPEVFEHARKYLITTVVCGGLFTTLSSFFAHLIRAEGKSLEATMGLMLGGLLNIALDPFFMFVVFPRGEEVFAAGFASALSNVISLAYYVIILGRTKKDKRIVTITPSKAMFDKDIMRQVLLIGTPACLMTLCENISFAVLDGLMYSYGTAAQAGLGVSKKVNMLAHSMVRGMAQGVLPLIAYNYGSGKRKRMKKIVYTSTSMSLLMACICTLINCLCAKTLISFFIRTGGESVEFGATFLMILSIGAPFSAVAYSVISFFQAVNKPFRSTLLALMRKGILDIPLMFILNVAIATKGNGLVYATPIADIACCLVAIGLFTYYLHYHSHDREVEHVQDVAMLDDESGEAQQSAE